MFGCQIKTKCWLDGYQVTCGNVRTMDTDKLMDIPMTQKDRFDNLSIESNYGLMVINFLAFHFRKHGWKNESLRNFRLRNAFQLKFRSEICHSIHQSDEQVQDQRNLRCLLTQLDELLHRIMSIKVINRSRQTRVKFSHISSWRKALSNLSSLSAFVNSQKFVFVEQVHDLENIRSR